MAVVYHWKHGWIPLDHADAHGGGIRNRQDVARSLLALPSVPANERDAAASQIHAAARMHGSADLLPTSMLRSAQLQVEADRKRAEADRIAGSAGVSDRAAGRLSAPGLAQAHRSTDSQLRRYAEATQAADALEHKAGLQAAREQEAARTRFTHADIKGATHVRDKYGWHEVVRVNAKSVTVKTPYSWTDTIAHDKVLQVARHKAA